MRTFMETCSPQMQMRENKLYKNKNYRSENDGNTAIESDFGEVTGKGLLETKDMRRRKT